MLSNERKRATWQTTGAPVSPLGNAQIMALASQVIDGLDLNEVYMTCEDSRDLWGEVARRLLDASMPALPGQEKP